MLNFSEFRAFKTNFICLFQVQHSMKARETKLKVWMISEKNGSICTGHCTCMAGLGEVCSHVTAVLYAAEHAAEIKKNVSCTDVKSVWPIPSQSGTQPMKVASMNWGKAIKEKSFIDCPPISNNEISEMLQELKDSNCQSALMRIVEPFSSEMSKEIVTLPVLFDIHHKKYEKESLEDLILLGKRVTMEVDRNMASEIESRTQGQSKSAEWYRQRTGRVTASVFKNVCHTTIAKPSVSIVKTICYPNKVPTRAMKWGIEHEETAISAYYEKVQPLHDNFVINKVGLMVSTRWPQLGASPDGLVYCDCCAGGCLEVKCPFSLREAGNLRDYAVKKDSCLEVSESDEVQINKKHQYYYQVQAQIFISNLLYCDFVVWCPKFIYIQRVLPDLEFWEGVIDKVLNFHAKVIMPELLGRYYTSRVPGGNTTKWCLCSNIDNGKPMVRCSYEYCNIYFFHIECVNLSEKPQTPWICPACNQNMCHDY